jgi:hypothetical protein
MCFLQVIRTQIQQALDNSTTNENVLSGQYHTKEQDQATLIAAEVEQKVNAIFDEVDINHDGVISHAEFLWAMTGLEFHNNSAEEKIQITKSQKREQKLGRQYRSSPNLVPINSTKAEPEKKKAVVDRTKLMSHQLSVGAGLDARANVADDKRLNLKTLRTALHHQGQFEPVDISQQRPVSSSTTASSVVTDSESKPHSIIDPSLKDRVGGPLVSTQSGVSLTGISMESGGLNNSSRASPSSLSPSRKPMTQEAVPVILEGDERPSESDPDPSSSSCLKSKERPGTVSPGPVHYTGILAQNLKLQLDDQFVRNCSRLVAISATVTTSITCCGFAQIRMELTRAHKLKLLPQGRWHFIRWMKMCAVSEK